MALPVAPIAFVALRYAAVAATAYAVARAAEPARRDQRAEDAMDETEEGLGVGRDAQSLRAAGKLRRVFRIGANGPGLDVELTGLARLRWRRA